MGAPGHGVTELLRAWGDGDLGARDRGGGARHARAWLFKTLSGPGHDT